MIRKTLFVAAGLVLVGLFLFGRHAASYVGTGRELGARYRKRQCATEL